jgi:hypothetical protein
MNNTHMNYDTRNSELESTLFDYENLDEDSDSAPAVEVAGRVTPAHPLGGGTIAVCTIVGFLVGPYHKLTVVHTGDALWCDLNGAGAISGQPIWALTGCLKDDEEHTKGAPGYLNPDGIKDLGEYGVCDDGIHFEALVAVVKRTRQDDPRVLECLDVIRGYMMRNRVDTTGSYYRPVMNFWPGIGNSSAKNLFGLQGAPRLFHHYEPDCGEIRVLLLGSMPLGKKFEKL